jgi:predicted nucleic acid-binding protein
LTTALDTNILSIQLSESWGPFTGFLDRIRVDGSVWISGVVYAELAAHPHVNLDRLDEFLAKNGIAVEFELGAAIWKLTGWAHAAYAVRRRQSGGGEPKRLLADFIVGAHAQLRADRLATLDRSRYAQAFPKLRIVSPG